MQSTMENEKMDIEFCDEFIEEITQEDIDEIIAASGEKNEIQTASFMDMELEEEVIEENEEENENKDEKQESGKTMQEAIREVLPFLIKRIKKYHELFSQPLIAEFWEETLHNSFVDCGHATTWKPDRSHKVGEDMRIQGIANSRISCKSGQFVTPRKGTPSVKFNGSRTTSQDTLEEKLAHLCGDHDDWYFLLAKKKNFDKSYKLLVFESSKCKVDQLTWVENESGKQWIGTGDFQASINKSMSVQLWTTLPLDMVCYKYDIDL